MKILAFAGMPFSGKSEAVKILKSFNIPVIRMGDMVWNEVKNQGLELTDENVGRIANEMRKLHGNDIWAKKTLEEIKKINSSEFLIIDGVRNQEEILTFKQDLGSNFILIVIVASDKIRYERGLNRNREDDSKDIEKIKNRDLREINWGLKDVITSADIKINNEGSLEEFRNHIKEIVPKNYIEKISN